MISLQAVKIKLTLKKMEQMLMRMVFLHEVIQKHILGTVFEVKKRTNCCNRDAKLDRSRLLLNWQKYFKPYQAFKRFGVNAPVAH